MQKEILNILLLTLMTFYQNSTKEMADDIIGIWQNSTGKGHIQIYKLNGSYYGKIIWLKNPKYPNGQIKVDRNNPNPIERGKPLIGLVMLKDFRYNHGEWGNGMIYNPNDGKIYKAYLRLQGMNTLLVRGYVGISFFGKTDTWTRVQ